MTYNDDFTLPTEYIEQLVAQGMEFMPELIRILLNVAMRAERQKHLGVAPYERSEARQGYANGYPPDPGGRNQLCGASGARQQLLSGSAGKRAAQ